MCFLKKHQKSYQNKIPWLKCSSRYCIQCQVEWYLPLNCIFLVCRDFNKKIQKMVLPVLRFLGLPCMAMPGPPMGHPWVKFQSKKKLEKLKK